MMLLYIGAAFVLLVLFITVREKVSFYTKSDCSICGEKTGYKGNERYKLVDGYMCKSCAMKMLTNPEHIKGQGPNAFESKTTFDVETAINRRSEIGDINWVKEKNAEMSSVAARIASNKEMDTIPKCPKCGSKSISADKKGFSTGKAAAGAILVGPIGLAAGGIGANKVQITCLNCGHHWIAGKPQ